MTAGGRSRLVSGLTALLCTAVLSSATVWCAWPLYGPLYTEFHWSAVLFAGAGTVSLGFTGASVLRLPAAVPRIGVRTTVLTGCLAAGLTMLLIVPNLTHFWQMALVMLALGIARGLVLAGAWHELRRGLGGGPSVCAVSLAFIAGLAVLSPWIAQVIYRNSWREGAATCGGLLLVVASPLAYLLLPGTELEGALADEP